MILVGAGHGDAGDPEIAGRNSLGDPKDEYHQRIRAKMVRSMDTHAFHAREDLKNCRLKCFLLKETYDVWVCSWRNRNHSNCTTMTKAILDNAVTDDPNYPFLRNFSSPLFHVGFGSLGLTRLEDGFLSGFPQL